METETEVTVENKKPKHEKLLYIASVVVGGIVGFFGAFAVWFLFNVRVV